MRYPKGTVFRIGSTSFTVLDYNPERQWYLIVDLHTKVHYTITEAFLASNGYDYRRVRNNNKFVEEDKEYKELFI